MKNFLVLLISITISSLFYSQTCSPVADVTTLPDITTECEVTSITAPNATVICINTVTSLSNAQWNGYITQATFSEAKAEAISRNAIGMFESNPNQYHFLFTGTNTYDDGNTTQLWEITYSPASITGTTNTTFPITDQGTTVVNWTYDDGNGNTSTQTQNVVISDVTGPETTYLTTSITIPSGGQTSGWSPWVYSFSDPIPAGKHITGVDLAFNAVDQGWGGTNSTARLKVAGTQIGAVTLTHSQQAFIINYTGDIPGYAYGATNNLEMFFTGYAGWAARWRGGTITFHYNGLPDINDECSATASLPDATDNCGATITGTTTDPLTYNTQGTHVINWSFDDGNGNVTNETQNVVISDVTAPVADVTTLADVTAECEVASITAPTATDNCAGTITGTTTDPLTYNTQGTHVINWSFDDGNGNVTNETQNVVISDVTGPIADVTTLADVTYQCSVASITAPTATDNCAGIITGTTNTTFPITTLGTTVVTWSYDDGNGNITTQIQNFVKYLITNSLTTDICFGDSLLAGGVFQTANGVYVDTLISVSGCDSILTTTLTVNDVNYLSDTITVCYGDSSFIAGAYRTISGVYIDILTNVNGCDSIIETTFNVLSENFVSNLFAICTGDSVLAGGLYQTTTGLYYDTLVDPNGCNLIIETDLTVSSQITESITVNICYGDSALINGNYELLSGTFYDTTLSVAGCDSITVTNFMVDSLITNNVMASVCFGDSLMVGGSYQTVSGVYVDTLSTSSGCDSLVTTTLTVNTTLTSTDVQQAACDYTWIDGITYTTSDSLASYTLSSLAGCDSVVTLNLTISAIVTTIVQNVNDIEASATNGTAPYSYDWNTGETTASITPAVNGMYWVVVTDNDTCYSDTASFDVTFVSGTGIDNWNNSVSIYPNPTSDVVTISTGNYTGSVKANVYDLFGRKVFTSNNKEISLKSFSDGVYILEFKAADKTYTTRIIKE